MAGVQADTARSEGRSQDQDTNRDSTTHTLTANKGAFDAGRISPGKTTSIVVKKPGTYAYHCEIHNFMKGTIKAS